MDESDAMCAAGRARRDPQRLQTGEGYARGGRVAMDRVQGRLPPGASIEPAHVDMPLPRGMKVPPPARMPMPKRGR